MDNLNVANGYGYATDRMIDSLKRLGHEVNINDSTAPVEIWFDQPQHWKWNDGYRIGYHPWESTGLQEGWLEAMNNCDEVWTPSQLIATWYRRAGVSKPLYVYEHGVDKIWSPKVRNNDKIRFLHVGAEAARKGGWDALRAFRKAFPTRDDVELTLKVTKFNMGLERVGKVSVVNGRLPISQMVQMYHDHDVYVYPSWGEGFGLTPLQAMATGMPTISVREWAPFSRFMDPNLCLEANMKKSPWQEIHPGEMFRVNQDDLVDRMRWIVDNYDTARTFATAQTEAISRDYDWDNVTKNTFDLLEKRLAKLPERSGLRTPAML